MAKTSFSATHSPKRLSAWSATAMVLAMMAMPGQAMSQENTRRNWRAEHSNTQASNESNANNDTNRRATEQGSWRSRPRSNEERTAQEQTSAPRWRGRAYAAQGIPQQSSPAQPQPRSETQRKSQTRTQQELTIRNDGRNDPDRGHGDRDSWRDGPRDRDSGRRDDRQGWRDRDRNDWRGDRPTYRNTEGRDWGRRKWDRDWRQERRYDWNRYRSANRHIYRTGRYHAPYDRYYYRPLRIGFFLDSIFFSSRYWIVDPWYYRLPPAYGPYRWVRYYDDVLLVDIYSGEVVDVIHDFFW